MAQGKPLLALGIETSCDETAAAVVAGDRRILSNVVSSQFDEHRPYGGVVPEIAARAHVERIDGVVREALARADVGVAELDAVAATAGPGLIGGVIVGLTAAKAMAAAAGKPFVAVNHLEGHALTARLTHDAVFPYLLLLVSGGHCQLLIVEGVGHYQRLGTTIDDAAGEAFDKVAKLLGLGLPGGPAVERAALTGDASKVPLPKPMAGRPGCDFSFSGLKTAVWLAVERGGLRPEDVASAFQARVVEALAERTARALGVAASRGLGLSALVVAGGVAANAALRTALEATARDAGLPLLAPPAALCTDNAAMIAWAGLERLALGRADPLDAPARARWPLAVG
jgi:N6-L-threonylcarbamoyladenine synthase